MASACVLVFAFTAFLQEIRLFRKPMFQKYTVSHDFSCIFQPDNFKTCFIFISNILKKKFHTGILVICL